MRAVMLLALVAGSPEQTSREVHERSNHPDRIEIAPGPRWTTTYAPVGAGRDGSSDEAVPAPQEGGGHATDEDDGWEGARWIDPNLAGPLDADAPAAPAVEVAEAEGDVVFQGGGGFDPGTAFEPTDVRGGGRGEPGFGRPVVQPEVEAPAPEPEPEAEPVVEQTPEPIPEPEPLPEEEEPEPEPEPEPEASPPAPPAVGVVTPLAEPQPTEPATPLAPAPSSPPAPDHRPLWLSLLALGALVTLVRLHQRLKRTKPKAGAPLAKASQAAPSGGASHLETTLTELDYAEEIRLMLRAGLVAVGWQPQGRELSKTAREVSTAMSPVDPRRDAVRQLVAVAEKVHFAGSEATPDDYQHARDCLLEIRTHDFRGEASA